MLMHKRVRDDIQEPKKVRDIPGFYFDYEKNRYFPVNNSHMSRYSDYLEDKNKKTINNIDNKNKLTIKIDKTIKIEKKPLSVFAFMNNHKKLNKLETSQFAQLKTIKEKYIEDHIVVKDLKYKSSGNKYDLLKFDNKHFLLTMDNSGNTSKIFIEEIYLSNDNNFDTHQIRVLNFKYKNKLFTSFKVLKEDNDNVLFLILDYEIFFIQINQIFSVDNQIKIFHHNFANNLHKPKSFPTMFDWPIIHKLEKENKFSLLFYKKLFEISLNFERSAKCKFVYSSYQVEIDLDKLFRTKIIKKIVIEHEVNFRNLSFTNFIYDMKQGNYIMCESSGKIYVYNKEFDLIEIIENKDKTVAPYVGIEQDEENVFLIKSNTNVSKLDKMFFNQTSLYESRIKNNFDIDKSFVYCAKYKQMLFKDEEGKYISYSEDSHSHKLENKKTVKIKLDKNILYLLVDDTKNNKEYVKLIK